MEKLSPRSHSNLHAGEPFDVNPLAVLQVRDSGVGPCAGGEDSSPRRKLKHATHGHATLVYHNHGHATFEQNGRWEVKPGDMMLIPAGQPHRRIAAHDVEYWGLGICVPCFGSDEGLKLLDPFERVRNGASAVATITPARKAFVESLFQELENATRRIDGLAPAVVQRSLLTLILNEVQGALGYGQTSTPAQRGVVVDTLRFIELNCLRPLTLIEVARAVGRSAAYVTTVLAQTTGKSVGEWITMGRIAEARKLLLHSNESVGTIAERVGYKDTTHFIRMFRRSQGLTPAAYRSVQRVEASTEVARLPSESNHLRRG